MGAVLARYAKLKQHAASVGALFVVPHWENKKWWPVVSRMQRVCTFDAGSRVLLSTSHTDAIGQPCKGPVSVFFDAPAPVTHQPSTSTSSCAVAAPTAQQQPDGNSCRNQLLRMLVTSKQQLLTALIDSGATDDYIDSRIACMLKLPTVYVADRSVVLADGSRQDGSRIVPHCHLLCHAYTLFFMYPYYSRGMLTMCSHTMFPRRRCRPSTKMTTSTLWRDCWTNVCCVLAAEV